MPTIISEKDFHAAKRELLRIADSLSVLASALAGPFVPWIGKDFFSDRIPRILFVGLDPRGKFPGRARTLAGYAEKSRYYLECGLLGAAGGYGSSRFWRFVRDLLRTIGAEKPEALIEQIGYSNVFPICKAGSIPVSVGKLRQVQERLAIDLLRSQLRALEHHPPTAIIFMGDDSHKVMNAVFGPWGAKFDLLPSESGIAQVGHKTHFNDQTDIFWTNHPRSAFRKADLDLTLKTIADGISERSRSRPRDTQKRRRLRQTAETRIVSK